MVLDSMFNDTIFYKKDSELEYQKRALETLETEFPNNRLIKNQLKICNLELKSERVIAHELKNSNIGMYVIQDLNLVYKDIKVQIDYIVITPGFIYLIEYKNLPGNISVSERGDFYRSIDDKKSYAEEIDSPIRQVDKHKALLKRIWSSNINNKYKEKFENAYEKSYKAIIVFTNPNTNLDLSNAPKDIRNRVLKADKLIPYIKKDLEKFNSRKEFIDSKDEMHGQAYRLVDFHVDYNENWDQKYRNLFGLAKAEPKIEKVDKPVSKKSEKKEGRVQEVQKAKNKPKKQNQIINSANNYNKIGNKANKISELDKINQIKNVMGKTNYNEKNNLEDLRKKLIKYRISMCRQNDVPEQYIFTDAELDILIEKRPKSVEELIRRKLLTPVKIRMFGEDIVNIIKSFDE